MQAFEYFGGIPHKVIFDNARVAVKEGFGQYAKIQNRYKAFSAHYAFQATFCNVASGNEKGLVENLVGLARRNFLVPVPKVKDLTLLNHLLLEKCNQYKQHMIQGREGSVETRLRQELSYFYSLPKYRFDTSKTVTAIVNEYSTVRFEKNNYSVPAFHIGKEVTVKAFGNTLEIYHKATKVASYERIYGSGGQTKYTLEHYMSMLEQKPRAVFHAKPVRQNIQKELLQWTTSFPNGNRDTVKLLRLCLDYGVNKIFSIKKQFSSDVQPSIDLVLSYLDVPTATNIIPIHKDVVVDTVDLSEYDQKYGMAVSK